MTLFVSSNALAGEFPCIAKLFIRILDIIINKNYASIEDKELAVELVKSYGFPSAAEHDGNWDSHVESDVKYFVDGLAKIGYLESDPDQFAKDIYQKVEVQK